MSKILKTFPEISPEWLLQEKEKCNKKTYHIGHSTSGNNSKINGNIEINSQKSDLEKANIIIEYLEKIITDKEKIIELLSKNQ